MPWLAIFKLVFVASIPQNHVIVVLYICIALQTTLSEFRQSEFSVVRQHEEFVWLHDRYEENEDYAGIIVSINKFYRKTMVFKHIYLLHCIPGISNILFRFLGIT